MYLITQSIHIKYSLVDDAGRPSLQRFIIINKDCDNYHDSFTRRRTSRRRRATSV